MTENFNINYSTWSDKKAVELAKKADTDGIKGLQGKEILIFMKNAKDNGFENKDTYELMKNSASLDIDYSKWSDKNAAELAENIDTDGVKGLQGKEISKFAVSAMDNELIGLTTAKTRAGNRASKPSNPAFEKAVNYYNDKMNSYQRYAVTQNTYTKLEERLYKMEHDINQAYVDCDAYSDIMIVPRWHYRYYPRWEDNLINFDIDDIRTRTKNDMDSLHQLKDKVEYIMEEANGVTTHTEPERTPYDIEDLAQKYLKMSYEDFAKEYKEKLDYFKTVTYEDIASMDSDTRAIYAKVKAYAREMLQTTVNEAHTVNWDIGERKTEETLKASGDMFTISEFEYDGITEEGLSEIKSGIMYKAFEEALIEKHRELDPTGIKEAKTEAKPNQPVKRVVNGSLLIFNPDGSIYDTAGKRIK